MTPWDLVGFVLCGVGLFLALAFLGITYSEEMVTRQKQAIVQDLGEMKSALVAAKVPDEQIPRLLRVHKAAPLSEAAHQHFIILSFFVLLSLLLASVGLSILLWAKLRRLIHTDAKTLHAPGTA